MKKWYSSETIFHMLRIFPICISYLEKTMQKYNSPNYIGSFFYVIMGVRFLIYSIDLFTAWFSDLEI